MLIKINLLNPRDKKKIAYDARYIEIINNLIILCMAVVMASGLLFAGQKCVDSKIKNLENIEITSETDKEIVDINKKMDEIREIQDDYIKWSRVLVNAFALVPKGNTIKNLNFNKNNSEIYINGTANTREDFLELKDNWEKSDIITNIESPISNLLYQTDVNFSLKGELNL